MQTRRFAFPMGLIATALLFSASTEAQATDTIVELPVPGEALIGMYMNRGWVMLQTADQSGCLFFDIGDEATQGSVFINGSSGADTIAFVVGGNDLILGGDAPGAYDGGPGNDFIVASRHVLQTFADGDDGNDVLVLLVGGEEPGLQGGDGDDMLCNLSQYRAQTLLGQAGYDTACGEAKTYSGIENPSCEGCEDGLLWQFLSRDYWR
jgi:hypothetical protein